MDRGIRGEFVPLLMLVMSGPEQQAGVLLGDAADALIRAWPIDDGEDDVVAVRACLDALHGKISARMLREALIRAAEEAGISVITVVY